MGRSILVVLALLGGAVSGCGSALPPSAASVFDAPEELEIFTLESMMERRGEPYPEGASLFQGNRVLSTAKVAREDQREEITRVVTEGIDPETPPALCFTPRHGLRAKRAGKTVELVICYACNQIKIFAEGSPTETITTSDVQAELDAAFARAGISPVN